MSFAEVEYCDECKLHHSRLLTCYARAKHGYEIETGKRFWTGEPIPTDELDDMKRFYAKDLT